MTASGKGPAKPAAGDRRPGRPARGPSPVTSRPATSRPGASARARTADGPPQPPHSRAWMRGTVLASILVMLAVTLSPTIRSVVRQQGEIASLQSQIEQQQRHVAELGKEQARWSDPAYVEQQARDRLKFVRVGDRAYTVIDGPQAKTPAPGGAVVATPQARGDSPWYGRLWQSVQLADQPSAGMAPVPAR